MRRREFIIFVGCAAPHTPEVTGPVRPVFAQTVCALEETNRFTACTGAEALLCAPIWNIDDVHRSITLAGDEQFVVAEGHVHRLTADLDRGLHAKRRVDQAHSVAVEAGDADQAIVRRVAGALRCPGPASEGR